MDARGECNGKAERVELILFPEKCTACMICVMACSFHHARRFDRKISSIEVNHFTKEREIQVHIQREAEGKRELCDECRGEEEPLSARYCAPQAIIFQGALK